MIKRDSVTYRLLKWLPRKRSLRGSFIHRLLGEKLFHPSIWKMTVRSSSLGIAIGTFVALTPTFSVQMLISGVLAYFLRANIPFALLACWLTNPVTMPIIYPLEYKVGVWFTSLFNTPEIADYPDTVHQTQGVMELMKTSKALHTLKGSIRIAKDLVVGSLICATICSLLAYGFFYFLFSQFRWRRKKRRLSGKSGQRAA